MRGDTSHSLVECLSLSSLFSLFFFFFPPSITNKTLPKGKTIETKPIVLGSTPALLFVNQFYSIPPGTLFILVLATVVLLCVPLLPRIQTSKKTSNPQRKNVQERYHIHGHGCRRAWLWVPLPYPSLPSAYFTYRQSLSMILF